jgi:putative phosphoribosyl transferase
MLEELAWPVSGVVLALHRRCTMAQRFRNREDAGRQLAARLRHYADRSDVIVLALPRGGVPVGLEVAMALHVPMDVFVVRKLGAPGQEELAMGAIASGGVRVINDEIVRALGLPDGAIERAVEREQQELSRRERIYRNGRPFPELKDRVVILVDDGLATGSSMRAAAQSLRRHDPARIVIAVPAAAPETCEAFKSEVDEVVCAITPALFFAVGLWYEQFPQVSDEEVRDLLARTPVASVSQPR